VLPHELLLIPKKYNGATFYQKHWSTFQKHFHLVRNIEVVSPLTENEWAGTILRRDGNLRRLKISLHPQDQNRKVFMRLLETNRRLNRLELVGDKVAEDHIQSLFVSAKILGLPLTELRITSYSAYSCLFWEPIHALAPRLTRLELIKCWPPSGKILSTTSGSTMSCWPTAFPALRELVLFTYPNLLPMESQMMLFKSAPKLESLKWNFATILFYEALIAILQKQSPCCLPRLHSLEFEDHHYFANSPRKGILMAQILARLPTSLRQ
jgi:hypothetical protein